MNPLISQLLTQLVALIKANSSAILVELSQQNVTIAALLEKLILDAVASNAFLKTILTPIISGAGPQLVAALGGEEAVLLVLAENQLTLLAAKV